MTASARGDGGALPFEEVVARHGAAVLRVCRAMVGSSAADDIWSETFLAAMGAYGDLRPDSNVRAWVLTIAHHKAIDHLRRTARGPEPAEVLPERRSCEQMPVPPDEVLRAAVASLAPKQRAAVVYRYLADLSYAEVADLLGCNEAAARRNAADGIATLRRTYRSGGN